MMRGKRHDEIVQLHKKEFLRETTLPPNLQLIRFFKHSQLGLSGSGAKEEVWDGLGLWPKGVTSNY